MIRAIAKLWLCTALACGASVDEDLDEDLDEESSGDASDDGEDPCERLAEPAPLSGSCCGCLCADASWSCSASTCFDDRGQVIGTAPEAGFIEVQSHTYQVEFESVTSPRSRLWYVFQPARTDPEDRPLLVFFNGGPGASSALLLSANTGERSIDVDDGTVFANPSSWTEFGNLLYIDAPSVGFSYAVALADGSRPSIAHDPDAEASAFVWVLLRFLARHADLADNEVILVGESYGGTRASLMLRQLLEPDRLAETDDGYDDPALGSAILEHFARLDPGGCVPEPDDLAAQFGHAALVQGWVAGGLQSETLPAPEWPSCPEPLDTYDCSRPPGFLDAYFNRIADVMRDPGALSSFIDVDVSSIEWMHASAREGAYGRGGFGAVEPAMEATFGRLGADDAYFLPFNTIVSTTTQGASRHWLNATMADDFVAVALRSRMFMTDARRDQAVYTAGLPIALRSVPGVIDAAYRSDAPAGVARPGLIEMTVDTPDGERAVSIRTPIYDAGHVATLDVSAEILADVEAWFAE